MHFGPFGSPAELPLAAGAAGAKPTFDSIPVVDLARLFSPSLADRQALAKDLYRACHDVGFFYAAGHGVPDETVAEAFRAVQDFFALDEADKIKVHFHNSDSYRGYEPLFETRHEPHGQGGENTVLLCFPCRMQHTGLTGTQT